MTSGDNKMKMLLPFVLLLLAAPTLQAQSWRQVDPTDPTDRGRANPRPTQAATGELGAGYSDLRNQTPAAASLTDSGDWSRADVWQVAGRSSSGSFAIDTTMARASQRLPDSKRPWSSTYWPFQDCHLAFKTFGQEGLTPMEMYDTYVLATRGQNPGAAAWEGSSVAKTLVVGGNGDFGRPALKWTFKLGHNMVPWMDDPSSGVANIPYTDPSGDRSSQQVQVDWWGHCNGWAAAAILVPEPPEQLVIALDQPVTQLRLKSRDPRWPGQNNPLGRSAYTERPTSRSTLTFCGADLKGLFTEAYLATSAKLSNPNDPNFYQQKDGGTRYDPSRPQSQEELDESYKDIHPHHFHRIMLDHMEREQGLVAEKDADEHVNNLPIVGWAYVRAYNAEQRSYDFRTRVYYADYAAPTFRGTKLLPIDYGYRIYLDSRNRVTGSDWLGRSRDEHPDFIWVPDRPLPAPLKRNPAIRLEILEEILKTGARG
ncbi:MAG: hypothetical protein HY303_17205 [Candidatus Wallbacteria bacterium]|nr:hypothetical protein [Candidatus Wallbacteria bacterium]